MMRSRFLSRRVFVVIAASVLIASGTVRADEALTDTEKKPISGSLLLIPGDLKRGNSLVLDHDCVNCHGLNGQGTRSDRPNLAGQSAAYLKKQIFDFQKGKKAKWRSGRGQKDMTRHAADLPPQEIADVADYYANLVCEDRRVVSMTGPVARPKLVSRCEICHGREGRAPDDYLIPRLAGQNAEYLMNQIAEFQRHARGMEPLSEDRYRGHPMMDAQAIIVTPGEARRLAQYFASRSCR